MNYPGRIIKKGESDKKIVIAIQNRLNQLNFGPLTADGDFGTKTLVAVKAFQAQHTDANGQQLIIDGQLGPVSWEILFGKEQVPVNTQPKTQGLTDVIEIARAEIGVQEVPLNSNRGPRVEEFQRTVGCGPGDAWCACFVYWCFDQATKNMGKKNPLVKTGGALASYNLSTGKKIPAVEAKNNPAIIKPGQIFILDFGGGKGHTGIITSVNGGFIDTIEGNTNDQGGREGSGVFGRVRKINSVNKGFLEYKI
jgi:hypothetical protein